MLTGDVIFKYPSAPVSNSPRTVQGTRTLIAVIPAPVGNISSLIPGKGNAKQLKFVSLYYKRNNLSQKSRIRKTLTKRSHAITDALRCSTVDDYDAYVQILTDP
jgi:hypothetical protein